MDMPVSIESIVTRVTQEVMRELARQGIAAAPKPGAEARALPVAAARPNTERLDTSGYKTPLVSERAIRLLHELTGTIVVPKGAIMTPMARESIRHKNIQVVYE